MDKKDDKGKRSSSFLEKFNTFRTGARDKKDRKNVDRSSYRPPALAEEYAHDGSTNMDDQMVINRLTEEEIDSKFEQMLDDMNLSDEKKAPLRQRTTEQKRVMLAMQFKGSKQPKGKAGKADTPNEFTQALSSPELKPEKRNELLASLRVALTNNPVSWVQEFGTSGLNAILKNLTYCYDKACERKNTLECVRCLNAFMNNKFGLMHIISHEEALTILARTVDPRDPASMLEAVRLLAAICLVQPDGLDKTLEGITMWGEMQDRERFMPVIQGLYMEDSLNVACMQLINAIVSTPDDLDFRLHLRNEFMRTGLIDALEILEQRDNEDVRTQVNVFHEHREEDADEFSHRYDGIRIEMDDATECFQLLHNSTLNTMCEPYFLSILQHLLTIRDDYVVRPQYFKLLEECCSQIVLHRSGVDPDFRHTKRFEIDVDPLIGKLSEDSMEGESHMAGVVPRSIKIKLEEALTAKQESEAKVTTLEEKVQQYEEEIAKYKSGQLQAAKESIEKVIEKNPEDKIPVAAVIGPGGPPPPPPPPLPGGGGPPPPPPPPLPPGMGAPPPPPPPPMPGMGGPPPPPPLPGMGGPPPPPPPPGMGGPPRPPGMPGFPGGPPTPMSPAMPPQLPPGVKPKKQYKPEIQMKRANWTKINPRELAEDCFWVKAKEDELEDDELFDGLKKQFASKAPAVPKKSRRVKLVSDSGEAVEKKPKGKSLKVLDPKSGQNLSIFLGSMKVPYAEMKRRIVEMDEEALSAQVIEQLIKFMPEPEQMSALASFKDEYDTLAEPEQFCVTMSTIKRVGPRLNSMYFKMNFPELISEVKPDIVSATAALEEVKQSDKLKRMLELILLIGNYMNSGSRNAQSFGFDISYITKLGNTKTVDNKQTLYNFLADIVEKKHPDLLTLDEELIHVEKACRVSDDTIQKNIAAMGKSLKQVQTDLKNAQKDKNVPENDRFAEVMGNFINQAKTDHEVLESMFKKMTSLYAGLSKYFVFDPKKYTMDEFFGDIKKFLENFSNAVKENVKLRETEEKIRRAKEEKEKKERERKEKLARKKALVDITADDNQEGVMDNLLEALKTGSAFAVNREKREGRKRTPRAAGAERRAQLQRSRSRQNIYSGQSPDIVREINFDDSQMSVDSPMAMPQKKSRPRRQASHETSKLVNGNVPNGSAGSAQMTEAEKLLEQLKML